MPTVTVLISLLVCLIPTTIGGLLSAIGIAGMDRVMQHNVLAMSGKAVEAAGDVNTLLLDKTGTITLGNRQAVEFIPVDGVQRSGTGRRGAAFEPRGRDARRPVDRRAGEREVRHARPRGGGARGAVHSVHGADADERRRSRRPPRPQRRHRIASSSSCCEHGGALPPELLEITDRISRIGRHAAGGGRRRSRCSASFT